MRVLFKSDTDYISLPSNDPFVQKQQAFLIELGYRLIEDWTPPANDERVPQTADVNEIAETVTETAEETAEETVTIQGTSSPDSDGGVIVINGKTFTKSELEAALKNL